MSGLSSLFARLFNNTRRGGLSSPNQRSQRRNPHRGRSGGGDQRMRVSKHAACHRVYVDGMWVFP